MTNISIKLTFVISTLFLLGCSQHEEAEAQDSAVETSEITPLTEHDLEEATLDGELGCSFTTANQNVLLVAMGVVASDQPSEGVIKMGGELVRLEGAGGFDAMINGVTFQGESSTVSITITENISDGTESPPQPAELLVGNDEINGHWTCGP